MDLIDALKRAWEGPDRLPAVEALSRPDPEKRLHAYPYGYPAIALTHNMLVHGPGATELLAASQGADGNSAVFACLMALSMSFFEPPMRVFRLDGKGGRDPLPEHPMQRLLDEPNPAMNQQELWFWVCWALHTDGNAYLRKLRAGDALRGNVIELWPLSPRVLEPRTERPGDFISFYRRDLGNGNHEDIPTENIVHLKLGIDERDQRKGIGPIKRLLRQVAGDDQATQFADALLRNFAVPGTVMSVPEGVTIDRAKAEELRDRLMQAYGGERRGYTAVLTNGATLSRMGFSPDELNLDVIHKFLESRICAVLRTPPAVVNLMVGLEQTSNYASLRTVYEGFTERTLIPLWSLVAAKANQQLKPDFEADRRVQADFDLSDVRALQEDENERFTRFSLAVEKKWLTPNEARAEFGYPPVSGGDTLQAAPAPTALPPGADGEEEADDEDAQAAGRPPPGPAPGFSGDCDWGWELTNLQSSAGRLRRLLADPEVERALRRISVREVERVLPAGAGEPLEVLPLAPTMTDARLRRLARMWDAVLPDAAGMLDAEVVNG